MRSRLLQPPQGKLVAYGCESTTSVGYDKYFIPLPKRRKYWKRHTSLSQQTSHQKSFSARGLNGSVRDIVFPCVHVSALNRLYIRKGRLDLRKQRPAVD